MKFQHDIDFTTLSWVKSELDATLLQARAALEAYVENPSDSSQMQTCVGHLHLVHGTLRMVELYGAALVVEEMERVAQGLAEKTVPANDDVYSVLMRGIVQLPDYLERLQSGHKDIPIILLPLLNDLRAARGEKLLTESVLFAPDLNAPLPLPTIATPTPPDMRGEVQRLRNAYQIALLRWIREDSTAMQLGAMTDVLDRLYAICTQDDARRLWWIANGVVDGVRSGGIDTGVTTKLLFGKVDREIKLMLDEGEGALDSARTRDLTKNFLYYLAHANVDTPRATQIRDLYKLDTLLPSAQELEHAQGSISGHNRALLDTVAAAIKEDLLHVKEALDIFLRTQKDEPGQLAPQVDVLDRVADTLGMLGLGVSRQVIVEQRQVVGDIVSGQRHADESALLDVAGSLLYVEASLDDHIERLGGDTAAIVDTSSGLELPQAEVGRILDALMREAAANLAQAKHDMVAFVEAPWDHAQVEQIPRLLEEVSGALDMLALHDAAQLINGVVLFVETELLQYRRVPNHEQMDALADALASIEYYIEATREQRGGRERILDITRTSLRALNYWPLPGTAGGQAKAEAPAHDAPAETAIETASAISTNPIPAIEFNEAPQSAPVLDSSVAATAFVATAPEPHKEESTPTQSAVSASEPAEEHEVADPDAVNHGIDFGFSSDSSHAFDDEIRDIFLEEVNEEIAGLQSNVPKWRENTGDFELLKTIRRSFHTLKGSSRLVGALALGDFSWKIENMLNRVLDKSIRPGAAPQSVLTHAVDALPDMLAALQGGPRPAIDTVAIKDVADRVALGDDAFVDEATLRPKKIVGTKAVPASTVEMPIPAEISAAQPPTPTSATVDGMRQLDPMLFDVLSSEVSTHLAVIDAFVASARETSLPVSEVVLRAVHTLNGAIAMVDLPSLTRVLQPLEHYVKRLHAWEQAPDADGIAALAETSAHVKASIEALESSSTLPDATGLAERVSDLAHALPEPELLHSLLAAEGEEETVEAPHDAEALVQAPATPVDEAPASHDEPVSAFAEQPQAARVGRLQPADEDAIQAALSALADAQTTERDAHADRAIEPLIVPEEAEAPSMAVEPSAPDSIEYRDAVESEKLAELVSPHEDLRLHSDEPIAQASFSHEPEIVIEEFAGTYSSPAPELPAVEEEVAPIDYLLDFDSTTDAPTHELSLEDEAAIEIVSEGRVPVSPTDAPSLPEIEAPVAEPSFSANEEPQVHAFEDVFAAEHAEEPVAREHEFVDHEPMHAAETEIAPASNFVSTAEQTFETVVHDAPAPAEEPLEEVAAAAPAPVEHAPARVKFDEPAFVATPEEMGDLHPMPEIDEDLLEIFIQEATEILDHADALMARLRESPHDREIVTGLQRDLHTVKGGAHMSALATIGDLGHAMESLFEAVSEHRREMTPRAVEALEQGFDRLHGLVQLVGRRQPTAMPTGLIRRIEGLVIGEEAPAPAPEPIAATPTATPVVRPAVETVRTIDEEEAQSRSIQEYIRVRADLLDTMVNTAGEVAIYRSRLEQQIAGYRYNLVELDATVTRLREQLRKLELETEAQILSRYQRADEAGLSAFDPLELDRFSTLQQLSRSLSESVSDLSSIQGTFDDLTRQSETLLLQQSRVNSDLQEGLMRTRMVPFDSLVPALRRTLRQSASELGKRAQLRVEGAQGEMDRNLLDRMKAPFEHMLRNALAHGIESPAERTSKNKPPEGTVNIALAREATEVVLRVTDDGRGLDRDAIRRKAIERGLLTADKQVSDRDLYGYILDSGFSTAETITQIAGRGVGMDVVNNEIKQLGGSLSIDSVPGSGATFTVRLPFTLAVTQAILVRIGEASYAIPMSAVQGVARIGRDDLEKRLAAPDASYVYASETYSIHELAHLLGVQASAGGDETQVPLLMTRSGDQRAAVRVDAVLGSREVVVKSVGPQVSSVPGILGATIMGDGSVVMILDLAPLLRRAMVRRSEGTDTAPEYMLPPSALLQPKRRLLVMVVDDSITMRKATTRVLERQDMDVITAKDGLDAVEKLQDHIPDIVVLDIEMPRMDGYEFATYMKNDPRTRNVPIIMVTSRTGEKHRQRAREIGVERYLGKPYQEAELLHNINEAIGAGA